MFLRTGPAVFRCLYNWLYWSSHGQHDPGEKPLDHFTWRTVMQVRSRQGVLGKAPYLYVQGRLQLAV